MKKKAASPKSASPNTPSTALYRRLALALPHAVESAHMGSPDFRIHDRIFAALAYQAKGLGTLKLTPEQQAAFLTVAPEHFTPAPGGWGRAGSTLVRLDAPEAVLAGALSTAYNNVVAKQAARKHPPRQP
jgi:hypothetical protein